MVRGVCCYVGGRISASYSHWLTRALAGQVAGCFYLMRDYERALFYTKQHLASARAADDVHGQGEALLNMGNTLKELGQLDRALKCLEKSAAIAETTADAETQVKALSSLSQTFMDLGLACHNPVHGLEGSSVVA